MTELPQTWSAGEICEAFDLSPAALDRLISDGKVGYYIGKRAKRFLPENVAQIRAAVEIKPKQDVDDLSAIGVTRRGVARRRSA